MFPVFWQFVQTLEISIVRKTFRPSFILASNIALNAPPSSSDGDDSATSTVPWTIASGYATFSNISSGTKPASSTITSCAETPRTVFALDGTRRSTLRVPRWRSPSG
jgi:hypothetical protein